MFSHKYPVTGIGVLIFKDSKVLLGKRKNSHGQGEYAPPGGKLDYLESFEDCARRETKEETGIEIKNIRFQFLTNLLTYKPRHFTHINFTADWASGEPKVLEPEKCESWNWFDPKNPPKPLFFATKLSLESLKTGQIYYP